jgi:hypothetical protein
VTSKKTILVAIISLTIVSGSLRFIRLGKWSFDVDELATFIEDRSLFVEEYSSETNPIERQYNLLPRITPLSYAIEHVGFMIFGRDEFGSRVLPAIVGTVTVVAVFLLLAPLSGQATAFFTALLIALWQQHLLFSQMNRFYAIAMLFGFLALLVGAHEAKRSRPLTAVIFCLLAIAAVFSHTVAGIAFAISLLGIAASVALGRGRVNKTCLMVYIIGVAALGAILFFYVVPLVSGWNSFSTWGESPAIAVVDTVGKIGWTMALLAAIGAVWALTEGGPLNWYWLSTAMALFATAYILPYKMVFAARYILPLSLPICVLAGMAIHKIYGLLLRERKLPAAAAWILFALLLSFPRLASHYVDGSRPDIRSAIQYVSDHWREGDAVCCQGLKRSLDYYAPLCQPSYSLAEKPLDNFDRIRKDSKRLWIVTSPFGKSMNELDGRLEKECRIEFRAEKNRYDSSFYSSIVYLYDSSCDAQP